MHCEEQKSPRESERGARDQQVARNLWVRSVPRGAEITQRKRARSERVASGERFVGKKLAARSRNHPEKAWREEKWR